MPKESMDQIKKEMLERFEYLYEHRLEQLVKSGLVQTDSGHSTVCKGIDGQKYYAPTWQEIREKLQSAQVLKKYTQGLTEILPVPFAVDIAEKLKAYADIAQEQKDIVLLEDKKIGPWSQSHDLLYFPLKFDKKSGGVTKQEYLNATQTGWMVVLFEPLVSIGWRFPAEINGRKALPTRVTPESLLEIIDSSDAYKDEQAMDIDTYITLSMLLYPDVILDNFSTVFGSSTILLGNHIPKNSSVPIAFWAKTSFTSKEMTFVIAAESIHSATSQSTARMCFRIA